MSLKNCWYQLSEALWGNKNWPLKQCTITKSLSACLKSCSVHLECNSVGVMATQTSTRTYHQVNIYIRMANEKKLPSFITEATIPSIISIYPKPFIQTINESSYWSIFMWFEWIYIWNWTQVLVQPMNH